MRNCLKKGTRCVSSTSGPRTSSTLSCRQIFWLRSIRPPICVTSSREKIDWKQGCSVSTGKCFSGCAGVEGAGQLSS